MWSEMLPLKNLSQIFPMINFADIFIAFYRMTFVISIQALSTSATGLHGKKCRKFSIEWKNDHQKSLNIYNMKQWKIKNFKGEELTFKLKAVAIFYIFKKFCQFSMKFVTERGGVGGVEIVCLNASFFPCSTSSKEFKNIHKKLRTHGNWMWKTQNEQLHQCSRNWF